MLAQVNPDLIPYGCLDHSQPCGHPSFWQTVTRFEGLAVVLVVVLVAVAVAWAWRQRTYRKAREESRAAADERRRSGTKPVEPLP